MRNSAFCSRIGRLGADDDLESLVTPAGRDVDAGVAAMLASGDDGESDDDLLYEDDEVANALMARAVLGCCAALPAIAAAAVHTRTHPDERVRTEAAETAAMVQTAMALPPVATRTASRAGNLPSTATPCACRGPGKSVRCQGRIRHHQPMSMLDAVTVRDPGWSVPCFHG
ncbi:hypothetical protein ACWC09_46110 [Streptomyces sp. NPDC001617]